MTTRTIDPTLTTLVSQWYDALDAYELDPSPANTCTLNNLDAKLDRYDFHDVDAAKVALGHEPEPPTTVPVPMVARQPVAVGDLAFSGDSLSSGFHPIQFDRNPVATYSAWNESARRFEPIDVELLTTTELPAGSQVLQSIPGEIETLWVVQPDGTLKLFDLGAGFDAETQETAIDHLVAHQFNKSTPNEDDSNDLVFVSADLLGDALVSDPLPPDVPDDVFIDRLVVVTGWAGQQFTAYTDCLTSDGSGVVAHLYSPNAQQWQRKVVQAGQITFLNGVSLEQENVWAQALRRLGCRPETLRYADY